MSSILLLSGYMLIQASMHAGLTADADPLYNGQYAAVSQLHAEGSACISWKMMGKAAFAKQAYLVGCLPAGHVH